MGAFYVQSNIQYGIDTWANEATRSRAANLVALSAACVQTTPQLLILFRCIFLFGEWMGPPRPRAAAAITQTSPRLSQDVQYIIFFA
jgi:hypothetical protein